jgi:arginase
MSILNFFDNLIVAQCSQGQKKDGVQHGGLYICRNFNKEPKNIIDKELFNTINEEEDNGYCVISNILSTQKRTMLIGGDHSLGISSVDAFLNKYKDDLSVLWIDAHADINDHNTSITGNIHGMTLGYHHISRADKPCWRKNPHKLKSSQLYYFGIRDLDSAEKELIESDGIGYSTRIDKNLYDFINKSKYLLISFDVDALDPEYMDSTGVMAENGLSPLDVKHIILYSINCGNLIHLDLMEFNPLLGNPEKSIKSIRTIFL